MSRTGTAQRLATELGMFQALCNPEPTKRDFKTTFLFLFNVNF